MKTPMMQQWSLCKQRAKDALLLFRLGDFYEAFYEDAFLISKEIDLTLTKRQEIPMCGIPFHTSDVYIDKLIAKGYKVAIAEQMEDPKTVKGIVKREIVKIVTPATIINSSLIEDKSNNFFISIVQIGTLYGISLCDISTSEFIAYEVENRKSLEDEIYKLKPSEFLISEKFYGKEKDFFDEIALHYKFLINKKDDWFFDLKSSMENLLDHFQIQDLSSFGLRGQNAAISAAGALLIYLKEDLNLNLSGLEKISSKSVSNFMAIDHVCFKNLEIFGSSSLLTTIDFTQTPMGGRLIKDWLKNPLLDLNEIKKREDGIEEIALNFHKIKEILPYLAKIRDLDRLNMKIKSGVAYPKDLVSLRLSLENIPTIKKLDLKSQFLIEQLAKLKDLQEIIDLIKRSIEDNPPIRIGDGDTIKEGFNEELDEIRKISKHSKEWLLDYQNRLREEMGIKTLKVGFTRIFGYYIEVSKGQAEKVKDTLQRRQTLANCERFVSEELKEFEKKIFTAEERSKSLEITLFNEIKNELAKYHKEISSISDGISKIDLILSLARCAIEYDWKKPLVDNSDILDIEGGRHPIIERVMPFNGFVPNNTHLDANERLLLITGPNMAGKSTYIRQVGLIVLLAQMGSFVPAKRAHIGVIDKLFSRIGAQDDLTKGQSTFMVEMIESANILNNVTPRSLVILDEIGRGTSTYDGISIAWSVAEYLLQPNKRAKTLFATHYFELTELEKKNFGVINYKVAVKESSSGIIFLRKIEKGKADKSYGIHVAKLAGLPSIVIKRSEEILKDLEKKVIKKSEEYPIFSLMPKNELIEEIKNLNIETLSPLDALKKLFEMKEKVK